MAPCVIAWVLLLQNLLVFMTVHRADGR
jgi:hypothetical protein